MNLLQERADLRFQLGVLRFERFYPGQIIGGRRGRRILAAQEVDSDLIVVTPDEFRAAGNSSLWNGYVEGVRQRYGAGERKPRAKVRQLADRAFG